MQPFIPKRGAPVVFALLLSGMMSFIVSATSTFLAIGSLEGLLRAWLSSWAIAFPAILIVAPIVRRILKVVVKPD